MRCRNCGSITDAVNGVCPICGESQEIVENNNFLDSSKTKNIKIIYIILITLILISLFMVFIFYKSNNSKNENSGFIFNNQSNDKITESESSSNENNQNNIIDNNDENKDITTDINNDLENQENNNDNISEDNNSDSNNDENNNTNSNINNNNNNNSNNSNNNNNSSNNNSSNNNSNNNSNSSTITNPNNNRSVIHFISTGSSDAFLIESNGTYGLIDSADPYNDGTSFSSSSRQYSVQHVIDYLDQLGVKYLDYIVATHSHSDHIGGMPAIAKKFVNNSTKYYYRQYDGADDNDKS